MYCTICTSRAKHVRASKRVKKTHIRIVKLRIDEIKKNGSKNIGITIDRIISTNFANSSRQRWGYTTQRVSLLIINQHLFIIVIFYSLVPYPLPPKKKLFNYSHAVPIGFMCNFKFQEQTRNRKYFYVIKYAIWGIR